MTRSPLAAPSLLPLLLAVLLAVLPVLRATAKEEPWARWMRCDPLATAAVNHGLWGVFLGRHVRPGPDGIARVDYAGIDHADHDLLHRYLGQLQAVRISGYGKPEQMAFWINLYNALMLDKVLERYPVRSVRDITTSPGPYGDGPWGEKLARVEGEAISLDDIEHHILRPIWRDARVHYALTCAALGCPDLRAEPYVGATLEHDLDRAAIAFINHPRGVRIEDGRLRVSSLYAWFEADFGGSEMGVIRHLLTYAAPDLALRLQEHTSIAGHDFDWRLNDATLGSGS